MTTQHDPDSETIDAFLKRLFPRGTKPKESSSYDALPESPTDVFAAAALLVERCELYRRVMPFEGAQGDNGTLAELIISPDDHRTWTTLGARWREGNVDDDVRKLWRGLVGHHKDLVHADGAAGVPPWWQIALALLVISDEACASLGFPTDPPHWLEASVRASSFDREALEEVVPGSRHMVRTASTDTFCVEASPYVARVVAKARTPRVGCTMRTLSHNLALLAPRSSAEVHWHRQPGPPAHDGDPLNILVVPFPYVVAATCFEAFPVAKERWGFFEIAPRWLSSAGAATPSEDDRAQVVAFLLGLVANAARDVGRIGAVVLPEGALDWETYHGLVEALADPGRCAHCPEFLISGSGSARQGRNNFVLSTSFSMAPEGGDVLPITSVQAKHHRWRLEEHQIRGYALASRLDPMRSWWERIPIEPRRVGVNVFRQRSTFAAMICEDLARSEPCHAALRAVGPNLVFVLLMDGPQVPQRWASQYATVLADDPGSSVLTLTSLGLVERSNAVRKSNTRTVALWKDDRNGMVQLDLPSGAHGIVLTLSGMESVEATLDGRSNRNGKTWIYHGHQPVTMRGDYPRWIAG